MLVGWLSMVKGAGWKGGGEGLFARLCSLVVGIRVFDGLLLLLGDLLRVVLVCNFGNWQGWYG